MAGFTISSFRTRTFASELFPASGFSTGRAETTSSLMFLFHLTT